MMFAEDRIAVRVVRMVSIHRRVWPVGTSPPIARGVDRQRGIVSQPGDGVARDAIAREIAAADESYGNCSRIDVDAVLPARDDVVCRRVERGVGDLDPRWIADDAVRGDRNSGAAVGINADAAVLNESAAIVAMPPLTLTPNCTPLIAPPEIAGPPEFEPLPT